jgi:hypothetical protein
MYLVRKVCDKQQSQISILVSPPGSHSTTIALMY